METQKMTFKDITRDTLVEIFNSNQVRHHNLLPTTKYSTSLKIHKALKERIINI